MTGLPLRGYQIEAVEAVVAGLAAGERSQVHAACGTGKTLVAVHVAANVCPPGGLVVVACPSLALVGQMVAVWAGQQAPGTILAVCGDRTVGDSPVRLGDLPCPVTRDPGEIAAWLARPSTARRLLVTTHMSADVVGEALAKAEVRADLLIVDEAHRTAGREGKHSAVVHHNHRLAAARRLYMTATPRYLAGGAATAGAETLVGMDDPTIFGPVHYSYPFGRAIADGWLDDYQLAVIGVTRPELLKTLRELDEDVTLGVNDAPLRLAVVQTALARAAEEWDLRRVIAFTPRVGQAREFAYTLPRTLRALPGGPKREVTSRFVHGGMSVAKREEVLEDLRHPPRDGWTVVANARCLSEGVDVPAVDGVLFTHPKRSTIDVIQAVGRALRRNPDGTGVATVIVPVLLPDSPDEAADDDDDEYRTLWQVVKALRAHDETLGHQLDNAPTHSNATPDPDPDLPTRMLVRLPDGYHTEDYLRHVRIRLLEQTRSQWMASYATARRYHSKYGHLRVSQRARFEGTALGSWLSNQRLAYRAGTLAPTRIADLEQIGMVWDPRVEQWQAGLDAARAFHQQHGHLRVPEGTRIDGLDLFGWLHARRRDYRAGALPDDRVAALAALGMAWDPNDERWQAGLAAARHYHREHGHVQVPKGTMVLGVNLHAWLRYNRDRHKRGALPAARVKQLEALGIVWDPQQEQWQTGLAAARGFHQQHGHLRVELKARRFNGIDLYAWLTQQRRQHRRGKLSPQRIQALDELGMSWTYRPRPNSPTWRSQ